MRKLKLNMDDGFNPEFVEKAFFDGILEMPWLEKPAETIIPESMVPITELDKTQNYAAFIAPYVYDENFADIMRNLQLYVERLAKFAGIISLDNSLYYDSPLIVQLANIYRSRALGYYFQQNGIYVIPNVRWGDERTYTTEYLPEKVAFLGIPKHSIVAVGTYGACKSREEKYHMREGLIAMLDYLMPEYVLIYGAMPDSIFAGLYNKTRFIQYKDWTSSRKGGIA